jgi:hypothetical protein
MSPPARSIRITTATTTIVRIKGSVTARPTFSQWPKGLLDRLGLARLLEHHRRVAFGRLARLAADRLDPRDGLVVLQPRVVDDHQGLVEPVLRDLHVVTTGVYEA